MNGSDIKFRDLKVFLTNRPEDTQMFNEIRQLSQAVIQNGGTLYDVIELYSTNSIRQMKKTFKELKEKQEAMFQQEQQLKQQELEQNRQATIAQLQQQDKEQIQGKRHKRILQTT